MPVSKDEFTRLIRLAQPKAGDEQLIKLAGYLALVEQYAPVLNLTGFRQPRQMVAELVDESLRLTRLGPFTGVSKVLDLGSGNGSPVVPLAITLPEIRFTAVEARQKRAVFLRHVKTALKLDNLDVLNCRTEDLLTEHHHAYEVVTSRAFAPPGRLIPAALEFLSRTGEIRGYIGDDLGELETAAGQSNLVVHAAQDYLVDGQHRHIYTLRH